ncbi:recombination mediator RecR [Kiritimatiellota bacterium B12222]|nr:recombination mediator RecR [Kiritimatiellota bacterium B12222]
MTDSLQQLIRTLSRLPGIGRRTAERMAYKLLLRDQNLLHELVEALERAGREISLCQRCGNLTSVDQDPCRICRDPKRTNKVLCVVEGAPDIQVIEQAGSFPGRYYCLRGKISPMQDETVTRELVEKLLLRIQEDEVAEVMLGLNTDVESDATASLLAEVLRPLGIKVTRLAFGLPAGSGLAYSDPETLKRAMKGRQDV